MPQNLIEHYKFKNVVILIFMHPPTTIRDTWLETCQLQTCEQSGKPLTGETGQASSKVDPVGFANSLCTEVPLFLEAVGLGSRNESSCRCDIRRVWKGVSKDAQKH